jgi:spore germination cell wall hydrolase CwlJ-like protein
MKRKTNEIFCKTKTTKKNKNKKQTKKDTAQKTKKMNNMDLTKYQKGDTKVIASNLYFDRSPLRVVETKSMTK